MLVRVLYKLRIVIGTVLLLTIGFFAGTTATRHLEPLAGCDCPKDLSRALEGCEMVASTVGNELTECRWNYGECQIRLIEQLSRYEQMMQLFLPNHMEGTK